MIKKRGGTDYPDILKSNAQRALYDNLGENESMAIGIDAVIQATKLDGWRDGGIKEKMLSKAIENVLSDEDKKRIDDIMNIIKAQSEY